MPEPGATSDRLEVLKARWEEDRGSRVFLQLADEYRRLGRIEEAANVLEEGLEASPRHTAAQVALGRCQLELGRTDAAVATLESVLEGDPTQMVAYRLLVEAYLELGKADEARERLRFYTLLNDADPEIAELRRRIGELDRGGRRAALRPPRPPGEVPDETPEELPERAADEPAAASPGGPEPDGARDVEPEAPPSPSDPFPDLSDTRYRRRFDETVGEGDLFGQRSAPGREESVEPPAPERPDVAPETHDEPKPPEPAPNEDGPSPAGQSAGGDLFELPPPPQASRDLAELLGGDEGSAAHDEPETAGTPEPSPRPEGAGRPPEAPGAPADTPAPVSGPQRPEEGPDTGADPAEEPGVVPPSSPGSGGDEAPRPTVTLGRLYLRQGHAAEAEEIFRAVLERDPDNQEARRHLEELTRSPGPALEAAELLEGYATGERDGLTERKRHVLERYLDRLRGRSAHDVR